MDEIGVVAEAGVPRGPGPGMLPPRFGEVGEIGERRGARPVRAVASAVQRTCARPSCAAPAKATLAFAYDQRVAMLAPLASEDVPQVYDLCAVHASRTRAPRGWSFEDRRSPDERGGPGPSPLSTDLGGDRTVAVLAAALRAVPDPVSEDAIGSAAEVGRTPTHVVATDARPVTRPPLASRARHRD